MSAARIFGVSFLSIAGLVLPAAMARGGITAVSRDSSVSASVVVNETTGQTRSQSARTTGFGSFSRSATASTDAARAFAEQTSSLTFSGGNLAAANVALDASGGGVGDAVSRFDLVFEVAGRPARFELTGTAAGGGLVGAVGSAAFNDLTRGRTLDFVSATDAPGSNPDLNDSGTLSPGRYELEVKALARLEASGSQGGGAGDVKLTLGQGASAVPLPAAAWPGLAGLATLFVGVVVARGRPRGIRM